MPTMTLAARISVLLDHDHRGRHEPSHVDLIDTRVDVLN
jgi:hypothetical protein